MHHDYVAICSRALFQLNTMHCPTEDHLKCHHSCLATSSGSHFPTHNRPQKKHQPCSSMREQSALMPTGITWDNAANWDTDTRIQGKHENTTVTVQTNRSKALVLLISDLSLEISLPLCLKTLADTHTEANMHNLVTQMLHCNLFWTQGCFYSCISLPVCIWRNPQPPLHLFWIDAAAIGRMNVSCLYQWLCCSYPCTQCLPRCDGE